MQANHDSIIYSIAIMAILTETRGRSVSLILCGCIALTTLACGGTSGASSQQQQAARPLPTRYPPIVPPTPVASTRQSDALYLVVAGASYAAISAHFDAYKQFLATFSRTRNPQDAFPLADQALKLQLECYRWNGAPVTVRLATYHSLAMQACDEMLHYFQLMDLVILNSDWRAAEAAGVSLDRFVVLDKAAIKALDIAAR